FHQIFVENHLRGGAVDNRTYRQLRLLGRANLADHEQVERRLQASGNLIGNRYAAPRQSQNDRFLLAEMLQTGGQLTAGIPAIRKEMCGGAAAGSGLHHPASRIGAKTKRPENHDGLRRALSSRTELACGPIGPSAVARVTWTIVPMERSSKSPPVTALRVK